VEWSCIRIQRLFINFNFWKRILKNFNPRMYEGFFENQYLYTRKITSKIFYHWPRPMVLFMKKNKRCFLRLVNVWIKDRQWRNLWTARRNSPSMSQIIFATDERLYDIMQMVWADGVVEKSENCLLWNLVKKFGWKRKFKVAAADSSLKKGATPPPMNGLN